MLTQEKIKKLETMLQRGTPNEQKAAANLLKKHRLPANAATPLPDLSYPPPARWRAGFTPERRSEKYSEAAAKAMREKQFVSKQYTEMLERKEAQRQYEYTPPRAPRDSEPSESTQPDLSAESNLAPIAILAIAILYILFS